VNFPSLADPAQPGTYTRSRCIRRVRLEIQREPDHRESRRASGYAAWPLVGPLQRAKPLRSIAPRCTPTQFPENAELPAKRRESASSGGSGCLLPFVHA
jgi:hypothetical protein